MNPYIKNFQRFGFSTSQKQIIELVGQGKRVLELGCSGGYMTQQLAKKNCLVDVVDIDQVAITQAKRFAKRSYCGSLDDHHLLSRLKDRYDVVVAADVIEHLIAPELVLAYIKKFLNKDGIFLASLPNIACWKIRKDLFFKGSFHYLESGILDQTHLRFYTLETAKELFESQDFILERIWLFEIDYPFKDTLLKLLPKSCEKIFDKFFINNWPNLSGGHIVIKAHL